ncbi:response regulator [Ramlibacter sp. XY19]|uniref:response regulator n=1 Tax=Ramlibacter paludis TaxID=2908000 RepID=UPI0023DA3C39|nr:response regulator [Ramlibacter paludis]
MKIERVFAVDDDDSYRELLELVLRTQCGVPEVTTFDRGDAVVAALCALAPQERPGLLLLDYHMPAVDGLGVLHALNAAGVRVPVVVLSNAAGAQERAGCLAAGARACLAKPSRMEDLVALLRAQLEHHG